MSAQKNPAPENTTEHWFAEALKKQSVAIIFAVLWAVYTFGWGSHDSLRDLKYQADTTDKTVQKILEADKQRDETMNQFLIALTKISEAQNRIAQDVKSLQDQQQKNMEMIYNRR